MSSVNMNLISGIGASAGASNVGVKKLAEAIKPRDSFENILNSYLNLFNETNSLQLSAEKIQLDYASGKTDDMLALTLAQEKAMTSLTFTVQVTNKIIEAYRELMRIQI